MDEVDWLPNSLAKLSSLTTLNLGALELNTAANQNSTFERTRSVNCSSNKLSSLPDAIGHLIHLKKLNIK
ncbi:hypothetical protein KSP40_PGU007895 [Platanthera guangdongensis]|uniref:Uncharacterized protein n=1 Tax=Platanthera guangdongensis TaxID=2320717 RepID=A0ABR2LZ69_9ASPA